MLSIERCRKILGKDCTLTDEELKMLRDQLYLVAEVALDAFQPDPREPNDATQH